MRVKIVRRAGNPVASRPPSQTIAMVGEGGKARVAELVDAPDLGSGG